MPSQETTLTQTRWYRFCLRGSQNPAAQFLLRIQYILAGQSQAPIQPLAVQVSTSFVLRVRTLMDCSLTCTVKTTSADLEASPLVWLRRGEWEWWDMPCFKKSMPFSKNFPRLSLLIRRIRKPLRGRNRSYLSSQSSLNSVSSFLE